MLIPMEIYYKILNYGAIEPPHFVAYKTAKIRPVFTCELNCRISGTIKLNETELNDVDVEYYLFLISLPTPSTTSNIH
jgi:hypothetical protein